MATTVKENSKITMRDIAKVFWRWQFACEMSNSYERMQAIAFCFAMIPVLKSFIPIRKSLSRRSSATSCSSTPRVRSVRSSLV